MKLKGLNEYDIVNYKLPSMFVIFSKCTFKCDKDCGREVCQNSALASEPIIEMPVEKIVERYLNNPLTHAFVFGGLEPFDTWDDLLSLLEEIRCYTNDPIIIYTGYYKKEIEEKINWLKNFDNIVIKFGRFIPDQKSRYDDVLGITLASDNQYGEKIS